MDKSNNPGEAPSPWTKEQLTKLKTQIIKGETPLTAPNSGHFQKGKSGNPKGRPRKELKLPPPPGPGSLHQVTLEESRQLLSVRGSEQKIPAKQAVLKAQLAAAITGNTHAQRHLLERIERAEAIEAAELVRRETFWREYIATQKVRITEAKAKGEPEPLILPHPDDVIIEPGESVRFVGPWDEESHALWQEAVKLRDQQIIQHALDVRAWPSNAALFADDGPGIAYIAAKRLNSDLPKRMRMSDSAFEYRVDFYTRYSKRLLLKRAYQGWFAFGMRRRRGVLSRPFGQALKLHERIDDLLAGVRG